MKRFSVIALLFVIGFAFTTIVRAEETAKTGASEGTQAVVPEPVVDPDAETMRAAWRAVKDDHKDLADKLEKIWNGNRAGAHETLMEAAKIVKDKDTALADMIEEMANRRVPEGQPAK